jgi:GTPase SAR1 family protein
MERPVVFLSYCHQDEREKEELVAQLKVLHHDGIELWVDDDIQAGEDWERKIMEHIAPAKVAVLLVSAGFLTSEFICEVELPELMRRRDSGELTIFPIVGKNCAWQSVPWLRSINVRPKNGDPVWAGDEGATRQHLAEIACEIATLTHGHASQAEQGRSGPAKTSSQRPAIYYEPGLHRKHFLEILRQFSDSIQTEAMERLFGRDALRHWQRQEESIRAHLDAEFNLTVIGPFKRGKSTLINALLGAEVVTSDIGPETVTINEIRYGEALSIEACLLDGGRFCLSPEQIKREELTRILAELPQPVSHLDVRAPVEWLRGLCLVDTPGTGDLLQRFDRTVQEYLARADAVVFVLSPLDPISENERAFLQLAVLPQDFAKVIFVVNMLDKVRCEEDAARVLEHLQQKIERMFPDALLFDISAQDELSRLRGEQRPLPERSQSLSAKFGVFRAHLQESVLHNRELIQIDRAAAELKRLLEAVGAQAEQLRWAMEADEAGLRKAIEAREDTNSPLRLRMKQKAEALGQKMKSLGAEAREWLDGFLDRLEKMALSLGSYTAEDLHRHFPFFLADALGKAFHRCLEAQRLVIFEEIGSAVLPLAAVQEGRGPREWGLDLNDIVPADAADSDLRRSAGEATLGAAVWERLEIAKVIFDLAQTEVFAVAAALMQQLGQPGRDRQKSLLYQQQFLSSFPELRRSVLRQAEDLYSGLGERLAGELSRQQKHRLEMSLEALRQGRQLSSERDRERQQLVLERIPSLIAETTQALLAMQRRLCPEPLESKDDGPDKLAFGFTASS